MLCLEVCRDSCEKVFDRGERVSKFSDNIATAFNIKPKWQICQYNLLKRM